MRGHDDLHIASKIILVEVRQSMAPRRRHIEGNHDEVGRRTGEEVTEPISVIASGVAYRKCKMCFCNRIGTLRPVRSYRRREILVSEEAVLSIISHWRRVKPRTSERV